MVYMKEVLVVLTVLIAITTAVEPRYGRRRADGYVAKPPPPPKRVYNPVKDVKKAVLSKKAKKIPGVLPNVLPTREGFFPDRELADPILDRIDRISRINRRTGLSGGIDRPWRQGAVDQDFLPGNIGLDIRRSLPGTSRNPWVDSGLPRDATPWIDRESDIDLLPGEHIGRRGIGRWRERSNPSQNRRQIDRMRGARSDFINERIAGGVVEEGFIHNNQDFLPRGSTRQGLQNLNRAQTEELRNRLLSRVASTGRGSGSPFETNRGDRLQNW
ncbi:uncharacterized protein [Argopecten irradians]|uniref:uncharacterized protein n=1 Tax=Argopecten irradians TaxID=31199 RepID=UPI0037160FCA